MSKRQLRFRNNVVFGLCDEQYIHGTAGRQNLLWSNVPISVDTSSTDGTHNA